MKTNKIILSIIIIILIILIIIAPEVSISACLSGVMVWATNILPALLPFLILTKLLTELNFITYISNAISPITKRLYNTSGISGYVYLMSIMSGYPVGAKLTSDLVENNVIDVGQAHRLTTFTSTSGPLFIIGTVAIGMFENKTLGYVIILSHFIGALLNGLIYRNYMFKNKRKGSKNISSQSYSKVKIFNSQTKNILEECMYGSIKSILIIGGYIAIFFVIITIINNLNLFYPITQTILKVLHIDTKVTTSILNGIIELTRGCLDLSNCGLSDRVNAILLSGLISFGGISINLQALTFLLKAKIKINFFMLQKLTHTVISMILAFLFGLIIL